MPKPLFRWTVGDCLQQGLDILAESINATTQAFGIDAFDWMICYNGLNRENYEFLRGVIGQRPVTLYAQNWIDCPIHDNCQTPRRKNGTFEWNGTRCGGSLWKVCPPRLRLDAHEIIMDNDIVVLRRLPQIERWLAQTEKALILEEPIRFYGRYDCLFSPDGGNLNSGLMGLPPGYDFGAAIYENWNRTGRYTNLSQADEQGLLTYTLNQLPSMRISEQHVVEVLHRDFRTILTGGEYAIHFTQANRTPEHHQWKKFKGMIGNSSVI